MNPTFEAQSKETDPVLLFLKKMANHPLSKDWTERDWQNANEVLFHYEIRKEYIGEEEIAYRMGYDNESP